MNNTRRWCYAAMAYEVVFVVVLVEELGYKKDIVFKLKRKKRNHILLFFTTCSLLGFSIVGLRRRLYT